MTTVKAPNFTKNDFLNHKKLAERFGAAPDEVFEIMRKHYKAGTPLKYNTPTGPKTTQLIVNEQHGRTADSSRKTLLLHPMGMTRFEEIIRNIGNTK